MRAQALMYLERWQDAVKDLQMVRSCSSARALMSYYFHSIAKLFTCLLKCCFAALFSHHVYVIFSLLLSCASLVLFKHFLQNLLLVPGNEKAKTWLTFCESKLAGSSESS